ncbi:hypothetical protein ACXLPV_000131 [Vibrio parahaemolyticus]|nr:hypothetical protein [Vibrio parahaemolyticus]
MKKSLIVVSTSILLSACGGSGGGDSKPKDTPILGGSISEPVLVDTDDTLKVNGVSDNSHFLIYVDEGTTVTVNAEIGEIDSHDSKMCALGNSTFIHASLDGGKGLIQSCGDTGRFYANESGEYKITFGFPNANMGKAKIHFTHDNQAPEISITDSLIMLADDVTHVDIALSDPNGDEVSYTISDLPFSVDALWNKLTFYPSMDHVGSHDFTITATDSLGMSTEKSYTLNVVFDATDLEPSEPVNTAPVVNDVEPMVVNQNEVNYFDFTATDKEDDYLKFSIEVHPFNGEGGHSGAFHMSENGNLKINSEYLEAGVHTFTVTVSDGELTGSKDFEVLVKATEEPEPENEAPTMTLVGYEPNMTLVVGEIYEFTIVTEDKENDQVMVELHDSNGFAGLIDNIVTIVPSMDHLGSFTLGFAVSDAHSGVAVGFPFNVIEPAPEPTLDDLSNLIGEPVEKLELLFTDESGLSWDIDNDNNVFISVNNFVGYADFDLFNNKFTMNYSEYVSGLGNYELEESINSIVADELVISEFTSISVGKTNHGGMWDINLEAEFIYNEQIVSSLFGGFIPSLTFTVGYTDILSGEQGNVSVTSHVLAYIPDSQASYLLEILKKHTH